MNNEIKSIISVFQAKLKELSDPNRAKQEKRYLKSPFKFYGVSVPKIKKLIKSFKKEHRDISKEELWELCHELWRGEYHEERSIAMNLLIEYSSFLDLFDMPALEKMLRESVNWDQVDEIAIHLVGDVLKKDKRAFEYLKKWSGDENFWMRRAALVSQILLLRKGNGNKRLLLSFAKDMLGEKEFFIRKAIGWCLREMSKDDPKSVFDFIRENKVVMSRLTFKEGSRRLPEDLQEELY